MEHRWGQRVLIDAPVRLLRGGSVLGSGRLTNASVSGALLETTLELPVHTNIVLELICASDNTAGVGELAACVVRVERDAVGIEWRDMACPSVLALMPQMGSDPNSGKWGLTPFPPRPT